MLIDRKHRKTQVKFELGSSPKSYSGELKRECVLSIFLIFRDF